MIELRWVVPAETTTKAPRLQYRSYSPPPAMIGPKWPEGRYGWSAWADVPTVVAPNNEVSGPL